MKSSFSALSQWSLFPSALRVLQIAVRGSFSDILKYVHTADKLLQTSTCRSWFLFTSSQHFGRFVSVIKVLRTKTKNALLGHFRQPNIRCIPNTEYNQQWNVLHTHLEQWTHTHTHTHTPGAVDTHTHTHTHTWSSGHTQTHTPGAVDTHTHTHTWSSGHTQTHTPGAVDTHTHTHTHTWSSGHTHTHTHTPGAVDTHRHTHLEQWTHTDTHTWSSGHTHTHTACNFIQDSLVWNTLNYINIYYRTIISPIHI